jgi:diguanylate cyclase (GGDEF)-like protein/PAS domain S-box-containing protein
MQPTPASLGEGGLSELERSRDLPGRVKGAAAALVGLLIGAALLCALTLVSWHADEVAITDAIDRAGQQRSAAQQMALLVRESQLGDSSALTRLRQALQQSRLQAQLLYAPGGLAAAAPSAAVAAQAQRELVARAGAFLRHGDAAQADEAKAADAQAVLASATDYLARAFTLTRELQQIAAQQLLREHQSALWALAAFCLVASALVAVAARQLALELGSHHRRLSQQTAELARLSLVAEHTDSAVVLCDHQGSVTWVNAAFERISGHRLAQMLGRKPDSVLQSAHTDASAVAQWCQAVAAGQALQLELQHRHPSGREHWLRLDLQPSQDLTPNAKTTQSGFIAVLTDITALVTERERLEVTVDAAGLGTWELDITSGSARLNERWFSMLGYSGDEMPHTQESWLALLHPDDLPPTQEALQRHLVQASSPYRVEFRMRHKMGAWQWIMAAGAVVERGPQGEPRRMAGVHLDISQRKQLEAALVSVVHHDSLTGLPNRAALHALLSRCATQFALGHTSPLALLCIDFDRFKLINDSLGHDAGDELLRQAAERIRAALKPTRDATRVAANTAGVAARLGGDEFAVLLHPLPELDEADDGACALAHAQALAQRLATRLMQILSQPYLVAGQTLQTSVSIGIVIGAQQPQASAEAHQADTLLRNADIAMHEAKRRGRARAVHYSPDMHERVRRALELEAELRVALARDDELFVQYQPIVDLSSREWAGVEALVRWRHPRHGVVPPVEFISLAEENGLIEALGLMVLRRACADLALWRAQFGAAAPRSVAVNLSRMQLADVALPQKVAQILQHSALPAQCLRLEITESVAAQDESMISTLHALRALGLSLSLDDFGTGYSSLSTLDRMPLDLVKIDRSFVREIVQSDYQKALVAATVRVAGALSLQVVAEGVEDELQAGTLLTLGCAMAQGYLFDRPLSAADVAQRLGTRTDAQPGAPTEPAPASPRSAPKRLDHVTTTV